MESFEKIYTDNYEAMFRVGRKIVYDSDVVSDIVQEVFIYFFDKINRGEKVRYRKTWLYRATYNKCIDYWRERNRFETIDLTKAGVVEDESEDNTDAIVALNQVMEKLKPQERFLVILYSEGLSYKEMAEVTEMKYSSVGKTLSRTLKKIENELKSQYDELYN